MMCISNHILFFFANVCSKRHSVDSDLGGNLHVSYLLFIFWESLFSYIVVCDIHVTINKF